MMFSNNEWVRYPDLRDDHYLPDFPSALPIAAQACDAKLLGINGDISHGGEAAYFAFQGKTDSAIACLRKEIPQGLFADTIELAEWNKMRLEYPGFPMALDAYTVIPGPTGPSE